MDANELLGKEYARDKLFKDHRLSRYIKKASILLTENDPGLVWDLLIIIPNEIFNKFSIEYGDKFVIDDHKHNPWVFTKVRSLEWLSQDFQKRLPIALWIYRRSAVIQDEKKQFSDILIKYEEKFTNLLPEILEKKYLEFRTERHNLRHAVKKEDRIAVNLIKTVVVKLSFEISFLAKGEPFPYKKWLPAFVQNETKDGKELYNISKNFLDAEESEETIKLSDKLVEKTSSFLIGKLNVDLLQRWWLHLD